MILHEAVAYISGVMNILLTIYSVARATSRVSTKIELISDRLSKLERALGNGHPGMYLRHAEWMLRNQHVDSELNEIRMAISELRLKGDR